MNDFSSIDTALWKQDESLKKLAELLEQKTSGICVVSFDFFDTLVSRICAEPSDLFIEVGRRLAKADMLLVPLSPVEFRSARIAADERAREKASRAKRSSEVKLSDIYEELRNVVRNPTAACELEFTVERGFCYLNQAMASLVHHVKSLGYKTAILSDTYFKASELAQILKENGFSASLFDVVLVSSERGGAKWNGHLYQDLFRHFDIHPSELLHIGDNLHADIQMSAQFGVESIHYYRTTPGLDAIFKSERNLRGTSIYPAGALDSLRVLTARLAQSEKDPFRDGAMVFGPVLTRYADWAVEQFARAGVRTVLALMREGEVLGELLARAAVAAGIDLKVIPCFVSRISTARAAMSEVTPEKAAELLEGSAGFTPQAIMEILGLGSEARECFDEETRKKPLASNEAIAGFVKLLFSMPRLRQRIEQRRKESHELAFDYLVSLIGNETNIGILDLGWSGSIQRNIARILRRGGRQVRTTGCYLACTKRAGRLALDGDVAYSYMDQNWDRSAILTEVAITACVGSTDGYQRNVAGELVPVLGAYQITPEERLVKARLRNGILAFQSYWLMLRKLKGAEVITPEILADLDRNSASILYRLLDFPTKPEAERLGVLRHDENYFGQNYSAPLCDEETPNRLRREGVQSLFQGSKCYWPQGIVARHYPRLVSALRTGWNDPLTLGRLGVWHGVVPKDSGITDEELSSLGGLLHGLAPEQVIFVGPLTPPVEEVFQFLWKHAPPPNRLNQNKPRLIFTQQEADVRLSPEFVAQTHFIGGDLEQPQAIRAIRSQLVSSGNIAMVFTGEVKESTVEKMLNGLAPFLGFKGMVLAACGRFDRHTVAQDLSLARLANQWLHSTGKELGYGFWAAPVAAVPHLSNWIVFRRSPGDGVRNQWMFTVADMAHAPETSLLIANRNVNETAAV
jgi:predicted HAD superfamily hydrolase